MVLALALGCVTPGDDDGPDTVDSDSSVVDSDTDVIIDVDLNFDADTATPERVDKVIGATGEATWNVDFDADAEAAGFVDCSYHRQWTNGAEIRHSPWLCVDCEAVIRVDAEVDRGRDDCYAAITNGEAPAPVELLGWSDDVFWRSSQENRALSTQGVLTRDGDSLAWTNDAAFVFTDGEGVDRSALFRIVGSAVLGEVEADPLRGLWPPEEYECGWPKADPAAWEGDYAVAIGELVPDGVFRDVCNDAVRLHDLLGTWLVIDVSAMDCAPCQEMADTSNAAIAALAAEGLDVATITFLAPSLSDPLTTASRQDLYDWNLAFQLDHPVLADRGYGPYVLGASTEAITGEDFAFPTVIIVSPEGTLIDAHVGFGGWEPIAAIIRDNQ